MYTSFAYTMPLTNQCYHVCKCIATQKHVVCLAVRAHTLYLDYNTVHRLAVRFQCNEYYSAYQKQTQ